VPVVYRFICPDGRSYVGAVADGRGRHQRLGRMNSRIAAAQAPADSWRFEILERLRPGCSRAELRAAEQRHVDRLMSWLPEHGFNIAPADWAGDGPAQRAGRLLWRNRLKAIQRALARRDGEAA